MRARALSVALLGGALSFNGGAAHAAGVSLSITPLWYGAGRADAATELVIDVFAPTSQELVLEAPGRAGPVEHRMLLPAAQPVSFRLGTIRPAAATLELTARIDGRPLTLPPVVFQQPARAIRSASAGQTAAANALPLIAATAGGQLPELSSFSLLEVPAVLLPELPASYQSVDVLILTGGSLSATGTAQRMALRAHLDGCGRAILYRAPDWLRFLGPDTSGCRAQTVLVVDEPAALRAGIEQLLRLSHPSLPDHESLRGLMPVAASDLIWRLGGFVFVYLLIAGACACWVPTLIWMPTVPVIATVLTWQIWHGSGTVTQVSWAEVSSGATTARYSTLLRLPGSRVTRVEIPLPPGANVRSGAARLHTDHATGQSWATLQTHLLAPAELEFAGTSSINPMLTLTTGLGGPTVSNVSAGHSSAAILVWNASKFSVPGLAPGAHWRPDPETPTTWSASPADRLLRQRARLTGPALLLGSAVLARVPGTRLGPAYLVVYP